MDPRYTFRKGYDTDLLILRSLFALDPNTNLPISSFYSPVADGIGGIQWLSPDLYFSTSTGIENFMSSVESFSTITGLYANFSTQAFFNFYTRSLLTSTVSTLFVSSQNITLSSLTYIDTRGDNSRQTTYFSSGNYFVNGRLFYNPNTILLSSLVSTVGGLGTASYISSSQFLSTIDKLDKIGYVNKGQLVSTTEGIYLNTLTAQNLTSTTAGLYPYINQIGTAGSNYANSVGTSTSNYAVNQANLFSGVVGSNTSNTLQTSIVSTTIALGIPGPSYASTVRGLGTAGYISSPQLISTVTGLGTAGYISSPQLISTVTGLGTAGYISSSQLQSTIQGLGGAGLISSGQIVSTVAGLGTASYISSSQLQSTIIGLGGTGLISTGQLVSTTIGIVANFQVPANAVAVSSLCSTVGGLGEAGYVSTAGLVSTTIGLQNSFYVVNASQVYIANATRVNISSTGSVIFMSTFYESSITYQGNNGNITASNAGGATAPFYFSSATLNLDRWSTYITANSVVTLTAYPNFFFANLGLSVNPPLIFMSSFVQGGNNFLSSQMAFSAIYPTTFSNGQSNFYNQTLKITMPGSAVQSLYPNPTRLAHYIPNALTIGGTNGFVNSNMSIYYGSTNSLFLTVQNLPL